jgi:hypothetical protein
MEARKRHENNAGGSWKLSAIVAGRTMQVKELHYEKVRRTLSRWCESYRRFHPAFVEWW